MNFLNRLSHCKHHQNFWLRTYGGGWMRCIHPLSVRTKKNNVLSLKCQQTRKIGILVFVGRHGSFSWYRSDEIIRLVQAGGIWNEFYASKECPYLTEMLSGRSPCWKDYEMHISDSGQVLNTSLTKCAKMTEEAIRKHGMNGNSNEPSPVVIKEEAPRNSYAQGGRLKFFKGTCF